MGNSTEDVKKAISEITQEQWSEMARLMGSPVEEVKGKYESFLVDIARDPEMLNRRGKVTINKGAPLGTPPAQERISIPVSWCPISNVLCLTFTLDWSGGSDWSLGLRLDVTVLGQSVWSSDVLRLTPEQKYIHLQPGLALFKMDVYIGVRQTSNCNNSFYVSGKACYYVPFSWRCSDSFDEDLYCF